ncbi:MAG TPA: methyltransferase regulatory domain-containing protein [Verrucomicrobiae bacterium]|nr:methyltransferase regulatory domain-containing protein [Verrucomicrobiae bacterium]
MQESSVSSYDTFLYPSALYPQTHPDRLATIATLMGLPPSRLEQARVLELGCGDGNNLITMACTLPHGNFLGIDLAAEPIRRGNEMISALGLKNVVLRQKDILETTADLGPFDYIIAHGLYSWVPEAARERILEICRDHLAADGVAYISYNAYPGNHLRDVARGMIRFHVRQFSEPREQIRQARAFIKFVAEAKFKAGFWQDLLRQQFERIERYADGGFFHDDLSPTNQPFYFHEFTEAAARYQLQYLAEADMTEMQMTGFTEEAVQIMQKMEQVNRLAREQYVDFIVGRAFRQTLLCRQDRRLDSEPKPERLLNLYAAADTVPANADADVAAPGMEDFQRGKMVIATGKPVLKSALLSLGRVWPRRLEFGQLLNMARERAGRNEATMDSDRRELCEFLLQCYGLGFVDLHSYPSTFVTEISARPVASPQARLQTRQGRIVSSLRHLPLKIEDALGRELLQLLDGTRDRPALLEELGRGVKAGSTPIYSNGKAVTEPQRAVEILAEQLHPTLESLARLGLLVG